MNHETIVIGCDHAGFDAKTRLIHFFHNDYIIDDQGCYDNNAVDYPDIAARVAQKVMSYQKWVWGVLICGSGQGMAIAANRFPFIRAALCRHIKDAELARMHNDANVLVMGARCTDYDKQIQCLTAFMQNPTMEQRHKNRVVKLGALPRY